MQQIIASITQRGQVTIPASVRKLLGAKPKGKISFHIEGNEVRLLPTAFTLEGVYGSVRPHKRPESFKKLFRKAKEEKARRQALAMKNT